jgi:metallophosphoesterase superfamily enzyme
MRRSPITWTGQALLSNFVKTLMNDLPLFPDLFATPHRFVWHPATATAILADLHIGAFTVSGNVGPKMAAAWRQIVARHPRQVILAGDVMEHAPAEPTHIAAFRQLLALFGPPTQPGRWGETRVILTPGNHDAPDLGALLGAESAPEVPVGRYLVSHGYVPPTARPHAWIVGHQHPAVVLRDQVRQAKMACYAVCAFSAKRPPMVLLPAFSSDPGGPVGTNLMTRQWILPVPRPAAEKIRIFGLVEPPANDPQVLDFGPLSGLRA